MKRYAAALLLTVLAPSTAGCVAAVVPLAAGAALVKRHDALERRAASPEKPTAVTAASDVTVVKTSLTSLPPPTGAMLPGNAAVLDFRTYALAQAVAAPGSGKRSSAIVPAASELRLVRAECKALPPAVFIDLDPGRGAFDPLSPGTPDGQLGPALADLRENGIEVVWFSRLGVNFASAAREALVQSGLDPSGRDSIALMRDLGERKQSLRDDVAKRLCPIAILGDERADFDELYLYLRNADAALPLDAMIGKGWFLASPFSPPQPSVPGDTP